jgi:hypothetical protein
MVNTALLHLCRAELAVFKANRLAGISVFALAETRPQDGRRPS